MTITSTKPILSIDIETYSETDIKSAGAYRYVDDPAFEILLFGYSWNYGEAQVIDLKCGESIPKDVEDSIFDDSVIKTAYNAAFERTALTKHFNRYADPTQWECTLVLAAQMGLPLSLDGVSDVMLSPDKAKLKEGKALIRYFCVPCKPTISNGGRTRNLPEHNPTKWELFKGYNKQDVVAENEIRKRLIRHRPIESEQRFWQLDQRINDKGTKVDTRMAQCAIDIDNDNKQKIKKQIAAEYGITNPKSPAQVKDWLEAAEGRRFDSLAKGALPGVIASLNTDKAKRLLKLREELTKTSTAKYEAVMRSVCSDEHVRGLFQFYGANRTGRFAGRLLQVQNLPRNKMPDLDAARNVLKTGDAELFNMLYDKPSKVLSELIRTVLIPEDGCRFIVADFSAIEARVIAWFAKEEWVLDEFRGEGKIYEATAAQMFGVDKSLIKKGNPEYELRARGKVATLALGYQGGANALIAMGALESGMTEDELPEIVSKWRKANKGIVKWWYSLEKAAKKAIKNKGVAKDEHGGVTFEWDRGQLFMHLPSGRKLCYVRARIGTNRFGNESIVYEGVNQETRKWELQETYGGKLAENCVQATARDCLRESMFTLDEAGFDIRMHVHDEVIINEPKDGRTVEEVCELMGKPISWAPGLPLRADGYETDYYKKD